MIKVISMQRYAEICEDADRLTSTFTGCRQRAKAKAALIVKKINNEPGKMVDDAKCVGRKIIYTYTENLGTKRFPDCYREVTDMEPMRHTEKMFYARYRQTNKDNVLCVLEDKE